MLFLLNDTVINLSLDPSEMPLDPMRFRALNLNHVIQLAAELYSEEPMLHRDDPERAEPHRVQRHLIRVQGQVDHRIIQEEQHSSGGVLRYRCWTITPMDLQSG